jgi:hypothetical protein
MIEKQETPIWKKALKWMALSLVSLVVVDWLFDGRLRRRLPWRRCRGEEERSDDR